MLDLNSLSYTVDSQINAVKVNLPIVLAIVGLLWGIHLLNYLLKYRLNLLGIYPRSLFGIPGIVCSPFLHGNFSHLFFNTIPLFLLLSFVLLSGLQTFYCISIIIILLSGSMVWLIGRKGLHVGASGVIMGYWGYLLAYAFHHPSLSSIVVALVMLYYLGSLVLNLFPAGEKVSWEGHVVGLIAGFFAAYVC